MPHTNALVLLSSLALSLFRHLSLFDHFSFSLLISISVVYLSPLVSLKSYYHTQTLGSLFLCLSVFGLHS